jgi:maltose-binding protein MalE
MKKTIFIALLAIFSLSAVPTFATTSTTTATATTTETKSKLTQEEISNYRSRVEEIRAMDKSELTSSEKAELKTELKDIKATMHRDGTFIYIGGSTLVIILILLLIL